MSYLYKFDTNRSCAKNCPCGLKNNNFFSPIKGYVDKGKCFKCCKFFPPDKNAFIDGKDMKSFHTSTCQKPSFIDHTTFRSNSIDYKMPYDHSCPLFDFLLTKFDDEIVREVFMKYHMGDYKDMHRNFHGTIFWQIDNSFKVRSGKIIYYDDSGKRCRETMIEWAHKKTDFIGNVKEFDLKQCLFGEHLLSSNIEKQVCIVESEKTAIICDIIAPQFIWLAVGSKTNFNPKNDIEKFKVLKNRKVRMFPDLSPSKHIGIQRCFDLWKNQSVYLKYLLNVDIVVDDYLEKISSDGEKNDGLDLADYILDQNLDVIKYLRDN